MSMSDGEAAVKNLTDKATYERLQKDVTAVKNDIAALTDQITDALNALPAPRPNRPAAATSRPATMPNRRWTTCRSAAAR